MVMGSRSFLWLIILTEKSTKQSSFIAPIKHISSNCIISTLFHCLTIAQFEMSLNGVRHSCRLQMGCIKSYYLVKLYNKVIIFLSYHSRRQVWCSVYKFFDLIFSFNNTPNWWLIHSSFTSYGRGFHPCFMTLNNFNFLIQGQEFSTSFYSIWTYEIRF